MKLEAVLAADMFRYDQDHRVDLLVSLTAPARSIEQVGGSMAGGSTSLGTNQCDPRLLYAQNLIVTVRALAGHVIERAVSAVDGEERGADGTVAVCLRSIPAEERRDLVLAVKLKAQKQPFPRAVNVFDVNVAFETTADGRCVKNTVEVKAKARFIKPPKEEAREQPRPT